MTVADGDGAVTRDRVRNRGKLAASAWRARITRSPVIRVSRDSRLPRRAAIHPANDVAASASALFEILRVARSRAIARRKQLAAARVLIFRCGYRCGRFKR